MEWINAQERAPADMEMCLVIGEPKTSANISCFVAMYTKHNDTFQNSSMHRIHIPREKARWWSEFHMPRSIHPMDTASNALNSAARPLE